MQYTYTNTAEFDLISDEEIITHLREDDDFNIDDIRIYINAAVALIERLTLSTLRQKNVTVSLDGDDVIYLPFAPLDVTISYVNSSNETVNHTGIKFLTGINPKKLILADSISAKSITVTYSVSPPADLQENIKAAILICIGQLYESRTIEPTDFLHSNLRMILGDLIQINRP